jgi:hypothetical protein
MFALGHLAYNQRKGDSCLGLLTKNRRKLTAKIDVNHDPKAPSALVRKLAKLLKVYSLHESCSDTSKKISLATGSYL